MAQPMLCNHDCYNSTVLLTNRLLQNSYYSVDIIPSSDDSQPLVAYMLFALIKIISLDNTGILSVAGMMSLSWVDKRLQWHMPDYNNLSFLQIPHHKIWTPTFTLLNPASSTVSYPFTTDPMWVSNVGYIIGTIDSSFTAACKMDLSLFPYDTQKCDLEFTDVNYWAPLLVYRPYYENVTLGFYRPSEEWTVLQAVVDNYTKMLQAGPNEYRYFATLRVSLTLQRNSFYYTVTLVFPTVLLQVLLLFVFVLPRGSALKVTLSASLLLTMYVLQKDSARLLPSFDNARYPHIITGLVAGIVLGAVTLVASVLSVVITQLDIPAPQFKFCAKNSVSTTSKSICKSTQDVPVVESEDAHKDGAHSDENYLRELVKLKREELEDRRRMAAADHKRKLNTAAWLRVECCFNVVVALGYLIASVYYIVTCLVGVK